MGKPSSFKVTEQISVDLRFFKDVLDPSGYSLFLASNLNEAVARLAAHSSSLQNLQALDVGTGCGIQAIVLAKLGIGRVLAIDKSANAVHAAEFNALLNDVSEWRLDACCQVTSRHAELQELDGEQYDLIVSNPPSFPSSEDTPAFADGGPTGREFLEELFSLAAKSLRPSGVMQIVHSSLAGLSESEAFCRSLGLTFEVGNSQRMPFRPFYHTHRDFYEKLDRKFEVDESSNLCERIHIVTITR